MNNENLNPDSRSLRETTLKSYLRNLILLYQEEGGQCSEYRINQNLIFKKFDIEEVIFFKNALK